MNKILFVDDEKQILKSLERMLMDTDYDLYTANSGMEALQILEEEPDIDLIISDMRMPVMDGFQLLSEVKQKYPRVVRIILSGYTDEKIIFKALQENIAKLYMLKPWNSEVMLKEIEHVFETERLLGSGNISSLINCGIPVSTIANSYKKILRLIEDDADIDDIIAYIEKDMVVAANVLRIANSAFFNAKTGSVRQALLHIGKNGLHTFLLTASVVDSLNVDNQSLIFLKKIWNHAFLTNKIYTFIYDQILGRPVHEISTSAGLLHKIGITVLIHSFNETYMPLLQQADTGQVDLFAEETKQFHATHSQVGAYLLDGWDFPYPIIESALYYAAPMDPQIVHTEVVSAVHIAQYYASQIIDAGPFTKLCAEAFDRLHIAQEDFERKIASIDWTLK